MAEDQSEQFEDKLEFTPQGEALGYISLDQARVLALQHARDNREIYGRFADRELVWEVINSEETEDYYEVRVSYRPAGDFRGRAGVEHFTVDKTGPIELRQLLSQPKPDNRFKIIFASVSLMVLIGAIVGALAGTGMFSRSSGIEEIVDITQPVVVAVTPDTAAQLVSPQRDVIIDVEAGSVTSETQLTYLQIVIEDMPALPTEFSATGTIFDLTSTAPLLMPISITALFSSVDATLAGRDEANVIIQHYHDGRWELLDTVVDFVNSKATAQVEDLSIFALTIKEPKPTPTPIPSPTFTPTPSPKPTNVPATSTPMPVSTATAIPVPTPTPIVRYRLQAIANPDTLGSVRALPNSGDERYASGTIVIVTASCSTLFVRWVGDVPSSVATSNPVAIKMDSDMTLAATCAEPTVTPTPAPTSTPTNTPTPVPTATPRPTPTPPPVPGFKLFVNGLQVLGGQIEIRVPGEPSSYTNWLRVTEHTCLGAL